MLHAAGDGDDNGEDSQICARYVPALPDANRSSMTCGDRENRGFVAAAPGLHGVQMPVDGTWTSNVKVLSHDNDDAETHESSSCTKDRGTSTICSTAEDPNTDSAAWTTRLGNERR